MLETGLCMFPGPRRARGQVAWKTPSLPSARTLCTHAVRLASQWALEGKGWGWGWKGSSADGNDFYQRVISKLTSLSPVSLDKESLLSCIF